MARRLKVADRTVLFERLSQVNPEPKTELEFRTPFELLIAVLLSAQATDVSVNRGTRTLFGPDGAGGRGGEPATAHSLLALGEAGIAAHIKHIGLFNAKAKNTVLTCERLIEQHGGEVPAEREALEALPGVGRKTANVVLNEAFGMPTIAVDTHVFRVSNRTGLAPGKTVMDVELKLEKNVPAEYKLGAHHWLILHGRYVCVARSPKCDACAVADICPSKGKPDLVVLGGRKPAPRKTARKPSRTKAGNGKGATG